MEPILPELNLIAKQAVDAAYEEDSPQRHRDTEKRMNTGSNRNTLPDSVNQLTGKVVDAAFQVHRTLGPGLLESVYEVCLAHELTKRSLQFKAQVPVPVNYDGMKLDAGFRLDLLVENQVILELKAVEQVLPVHEAQLLTYLKLMRLRLGLLINFNVPVIKDGIKRLVR